MFFEGQSWEMLVAVAQKANVMGCTALGSRAGWFAGHGLGWGSFSSG